MLIKEDQVKIIDKGAKKLENIPRRINYWKSTI